MKYEIDNKEYISAKDLGRCLGYNNPINAISAIYQRNKEELKYNIKVDSLSTNSPGRPNRLFDEVGASLVAMFAKTEIAEGGG
jgi:prophage antirepressor-like protein